MIFEQPVPLVTLQNVSYTHWNHQEPTLKDVSLALLPGTLNVLVGPGGSGKSTLCDLFNGKIPHLLDGELQGEIRVAGQNTRETDVKDLARTVGQVFQDPETMFATLTVEDEICFGPENLRFTVPDILASLEELLATTRLAPFRDNLVWNLSGGQIQMLGLAAVLAMKPKLIVLDEPTSNLDPVATRRVHELVLALRDQGMTVLLVTRELDEFLAQADQLLVLDEGRLLAAGEPRVVLREHGAYLVDRLGIWLPETSEVGIALQAARYGVGQPVPITVPEAVAMVQASGLLQPVLQGKPSRAEAIAGETLVTARNLTFAYGDSAQALKGVTLAVRAGEMLAIVGRNGAGKSTLARLMVGLQKPQGGELTLFGQDARRWKVQDLSNQVALVFQNPEHQFLTDTVSEEIEYSLLSHGMTDPDERKRAIEGHLQTLGLISAAGAHPFALSAGMKRRLGVATMLVGQPRILIVDEPTYGQDQQMTHTLMERLEQIRAQGIAIVMVTHDMRLVQEYAERVVVMSEGLILFDGSPGRLFECPDVLEAANLRPTLLQEMVQALQGQGVRVEGDLRSTADFLDALFAQTEVRDGQR